MLIEKKNMQNRKPMILVIAGPNGSKVVERYYKSINNIRQYPT